MIVDDMPGVLIVNARGQTRATKASDVPNWRALGWIPFATEPETCPTRTSAPIARRGGYEMLVAVDCVHHKRTRRCPRDRVLTWLTVDGSASDIVALVDLARRIAGDRLEKPVRPELARDVNARPYLWVVGWGPPVRGCGPSHDAYVWMPEPSVESLSDLRRLRPNWLVFGDRSYR